MICVSILPSHIKLRSKTQEGVRVSSYYIKNSTSQDIKELFFIDYRNIIAQNIYIFHNFAAIKYRTNGI